MRPLELRNPRPVQIIFGQTRFAWVWLAVRLYLGWQCLTAGRRRLEDPQWMQRGGTLRAYRERTSSPPPAGSVAANRGLYDDLIAFMLRHEWYAWIAPAVAVGAVVAGVALILGVLVGVAAFVGTLLIIQFPLAIPAGANLLALPLAILLMFAWKTAGWFGLDRWFLPVIGAP